MKTMFALGLTVAAMMCQPANAAPELQKWQKQALKVVKAENYVIDARWRWPESNMLWVAMEHDGSRQDGYAETLCMLLMQNGAPEGDLKTVWVYDPVTYEKGGGSSIGLAACR